MKSPKTIFLIFIFIVGFSLSVKISKPRTISTLEELVGICPLLTLSNKLELKNVEGMGNCLVAKEDIDEKEEILIIPVENVK